MYRWGGGVLVLCGAFPSRRGLLAPRRCAERSELQEPRIYGTSRQSDDCRDVLYNSDGVGETLTEGLPSARARSPYDVGARGAKAGYAERACSAQDEPA